MSPKRQLQVAGYIAGGIFLLGFNVLPDYFMWLMTLAVAVFAVPFLASTVRTLRNVGGVTTRQPQDVSLENHVPTPNAARLIAEATELGFVRLGETVTHVEGSRHNGITWVLINEDRTITAEVIDIGGDMPAMLEFSTMFMDEASLDTLYPIGETKDFPLLRVRFSAISAAIAYELHIQNRRVMETEHGTPRRIPSMIEYLNLGMRYRELHGRNKLSGAVLPSVLTSLFFVMMFIFSLFGAVMTSYPNLFSDDLNWSLTCLMIGAILIIGVFGISANRRNTRMANLVTAAKKRQDKATRPRRRIFGR